MSQSRLRNSDINDRLSSVGLFVKYRPKMPTATITSDTTVARTSLDSKSENDRANYFWYLLSSSSGGAAYLFIARLADEMAAFWSSYSSRLSTFGICLKLLEAFDPIVYALLNAIPVPDPLEFLEFLVLYDVLELLVFIFFAWYPSMSSPVNLLRSVSWSWSTNSSYSSPFDVLRLKFFFLP